MFETFPHICMVTDTLIGWKKMRVISANGVPRFGKTVTLLVSVWITCAIANECSKSFQIKADFFNKSLNGHSLVELHVENQRICAYECIFISMCRSIDYFQGKCKLNDADSKSASQEEFVDKLGAIFSDVSSWPYLIAGACEKRPCSETQKCVPFNGGYKCEDIDMATDCNEVRRRFPSAISGQYKVQLWKSRDLLTVVCDMHTEGGGWTVLQTRFDGSVDFYRNSTEYENGFGDLSTEFWLGLKYLQEMASKGKTELRFDLTVANGTVYYETFTNFTIDIGPRYTIHFDPGFGTAGDTEFRMGMSNNNGMHFTTKDEDRDVDGRNNCAIHLKGAWWFSACGGTNLNGQYVTPGTQHHPGYWRGIMYIPLGTESLKETKVMFRRAITMD